jgi:selenocysteine lyase/cysteine desulfurase
VIAISWVQYQTGAVTELRPLTQLARQRNIWTVVDGIQGLGQMAFDFAQSGVDAFCGGSHKWCLGPVGAGFLAIRRERIKELQPIMVGAGTFPLEFDGRCCPDHNTPKEWDGTYRDNSAAKFESGSKQVLEIIGLGTSVNLLLEAGVAAIQAEVERLAMILRQGLLEKGYETHSPLPGKEVGGIVNFSSQKGIDNAVQALRQNKVSFALRGPGIRLSPHAFNTDEEIERVLDFLALDS